MSPQVRPGRQPVTASAQTTSAISVRSASGYARLVAMAAGEPPVASSTAWKTTAVPDAATARPPMSAVEPEAAAQVAGTRAQEQDRSRRKRAGRRARKTRPRARGTAAFGVDKGKRPDRVADAPGADGASHQDPGGPIAFAGNAARDAENGGREDDRVVAAAVQHCADAFAERERVLQRADDEGRIDRQQRPCERPVGGRTRMSPRIGSIGRCAYPPPGE